jgi:molybdate transport system substrate-binding protein
VSIARPRRWLTLVFALLIPVGCDGPVTPSTSQVRVAAASDLQTVLPILATAFRQEHHIEILATYGASGELARQIRQGAPYDVFLSADRDFVEGLVPNGHIKKETIQPYARGTLVLAVNKLWGVKIDGLADLMKPEVKKIAIANPETAPYGKAAKQALDKAKLWDDLRSKIVPAESVRQALQMVQSGNAEVALVGRAIADVPEVTIVTLPADLYDPIIQYLGVVTFTDRPEQAKAFAEFMQGDVALGILFQMGFRGVKPTNSGDDSKTANPAAGSAIQ